MENTIPDLEAKCDHCKGEFREPDKPWEECRKCAGTGLMLTDAGQKVLALVRRRLEVTASANVTVR